jgi:hypothetical protein
VLYIKESATPNSLESMNSKQVKEAVYGQRAARRKIEQSVSKVTTDTDFQDLTKKSKSFKAF